MEINNCVVISDLHCGDTLGLCPPDGIVLDDGGIYQLSAPQKALWDCWKDFTERFIPERVHGEPFVLVVNGDAIEGCHHRATHQISQNKATQEEIAYQVLKPLVDRATHYYHIRGTEAHVGQSGEDEERLAKRLGAIPNEFGNYARYELWLNMHGELVHFLHHIGVTGSMHYSTTAINKELMEAIANAGLWNEQPPTMVVRSHRHQHWEVRTHGSRGEISAFTTAGWQLKTPFAWRAPGSRQSLPQVGGSLIKWKGDILYSIHQIYPLKRTKIEYAKETKDV